MPKPCKKCGKCCQEFYFNYSVEEVKNNLEKWIRIGNNKCIAEWAKYLLMVKRKGRRLKSGQFKASCNFYMDGCTIYFTRPEMCSKFPYGKAGMHEGCGYKGRKKT